MELGEWAAEVERRPGGPGPRPGWQLFDSGWVGVLFGLGQLCAAGLTWSVAARGWSSVLAGPVMLGYFALSAAAVAVWALVSGLLLLHQRRWGQR